MCKSVKILVVRYRFIGDTILTVPFLRNLRKNYPDAQIDMLVAPVSGEVIANCPYVDNFIFFDTTKKHRYENSDRKKKTFFSYVKLLRKEKYDKAYVLKRSFSSAMLVFLAGIRKRIGFDTEGRGFLLTNRVKYNNKHEVDCFLDVLREDGLVVKDNYLENWVDEKALEKVEKELENYSGKKKILVHATSGNIKKEWDEKKFAEIIEYISNTKDAIPVFSGTLKDSEKYERILSLVNTDLKNIPLNFCGKFNLQESLALCKLCDLLVGSDSGNLHMAASVSTPVIGIYGPMDYKRWFALGDNNIILHENLSCMPCGLKRKCKNNYACLKNITVENVKNAIDKFIY